MTPEAVLGKRERASHVTGLWKNVSGRWWTKCGVWGGKGSDRLHEERGQCGWCVVGKKKRVWAGQAEASTRRPKSRWSSVFSLRAGGGQWKILNRGVGHTLDDIVCMALLKHYIIMEMSSKQVLSLQVLRYSNWVYNCVRFCPSMFSIAQYFIVLFFIKIFDLLLKSVVSFLFLWPALYWLPYLLRKNIRLHKYPQMKKFLELGVCWNEPMLYLRGFSEIWLTDKKKSILLK